MGFLDQVGTVFTNLGHGIVNTAGRPAPQYQVDDSGKMQPVEQQGSPGQLFKNIFAGMVQGLAGSAGAHNFGEGIAGGAASELGALQRRDVQARQQAQQDFNNNQTQQKNADEHAVAMSDIDRNKALIANYNMQWLKGKQELNDANVAHIDKHIAQDKQRQDGLNTAILAASGKPPEYVFQDQPEQVAMKLAGGLEALNSTGFVTGKEPAIGPDGKPILDASGNQVYTLKYSMMRLPDKVQVTGKTLQDWKGAGIVPKNMSAFEVPSGQFLATWNSANQILAFRQQQDTAKAKLAETNAATASHQATAREAFARVQGLTADIEDKKLARQATQDWGAALTEAGNDPTKAVAIFKTKYPKSYSLLASQETIDLAKNGETITQGDGENKTVIKRQRLFTQAPQSNQISPQQQQAILTQAKKDIAEGKTKEQIQSNLQQALGAQAGPVIQWLESQGAFKEEPTGFDALPVGWSTQIN